MAHEATVPLSVHFLSHDKYLCASHRHTHHIEKDGSHVVEEGGDGKDGTDTDDDASHDSHHVVPLQLTQSTDEAFLVL